MTALSLSTAAMELGRSPATLRRWVREGCPATPGGRGRGKGHRVEIAAVRAWLDAKAPRHDATLRTLAGLSLDFYRRGCEVDERGHRLLSIPDHKAAAFLAVLLDYFALRLIGPENDLRTPELELLAAIAREGLHVHGMSDSV